jgi:hypothetical protein
LVPNTALRAILAASSELHIVQESPDCSTILAQGVSPRPQRERGPTIRADEETDDREYGTYNKSVPSHLADGERAFQDSADEHEARNTENQSYSRAYCSTDDSEAGDFQKQHGLGR